MPIKNNQNFRLITNFLLLAVVISSLATNQIIIGKISSLVGAKEIFAFSWPNLPVASGNLSLAGDALQDSIKLVVSHGVPAIYGQELAVSFDAVQQSINVMKQFDPAYGPQKITLAGDDLQRYINVGLKISCEYCCGAKSIVFNNGQAACGCEHSQAMRGLLAYLITKHASEYSDDELLRELARWKGMFFPKQMIAKLSGQLSGQEFTPDTAALVLGIQLPSYGQGQNNPPLPSEIKDLPSMVGGC